MNDHAQSNPGIRRGELRIRTHDPGEYTDVVSVIGPGCKAHVYRGRAFNFSVRAHLLSKLRVFLADMEHGNVLRPPEDFIGLTIPLRGEFKVAERRRPETYVPGQAHVLRNDREFDLRVADTTKVLVINADTRALADHGRELLGEDSPEAVLPRGGNLSFDTRYARSLWLSLGAIWRDLCDARVSWQSPVGAAEFEQRLMTTLCLAYSGLDEDDEGRCGRKCLERAVDYLMANLSQPISLADLARFSKVSGPTLIRAFREHYQTTPIAFLRARRLDAVHRTLLTADPEEGLVTNTALRYGFAHLGRFAESYFNAFGEKPSDTMRANTGIGI